MSHQQRRLIPAGERDRMILALEDEILSAKRYWAEGSSGGRDDEPTWGEKQAFFTGINKAIRLVRDWPTEADS